MDSDNNRRSDRIAMKGGWRNPLFRDNENSNDMIGAGEATVSQKITQSEIMEKSIEIASENQVSPEGDDTISVESECVSENIDQFANNNQEVVSKTIEERHSEKDQTEKLSSAMMNSFEKFQKCLTEKIQKQSDILDKLHSQIQTHSQTHKQHAEVLNRLQSQLQTQANTQSNLQTQVNGLSENFDAWTQDKSIMFDDIIKKKDEQFDHLAEEKNTKFEELTYEKSKEFNNFIQEKNSQFDEIIHEKSTKLDTLTKKISTNLDAVHQENSTKIEELSVQISTKLDEVNQRKHSQIDQLEEVITAKLQAVNQEKSVRIEELTNILNSKLEKKDKKMMKLIKI